MSTAERARAANLFGEDWLWFATRRAVDTAVEVDFVVDLFTSIGFGDEGEDASAVLFEEQSLDAGSRRIESHWTLVLPGGKRRGRTFSHRLYTAAEPESPRVV